MKALDFITDELIPVVIDELMKKRTGSEILINRMPYFADADQNQSNVNTTLNEKINYLLEEEKVNLDKEKYTNYLLKELLTYLEYSSLDESIKEKCKTETEESDLNLKNAQQRYDVISSVQSMISDRFRVRV